MRRRVVGRRQSAPAGSRAPTGFVGRFSATADCTDGHSVGAGKKEKLHRWEKESGILQGESGSWFIKKAHL